MNEINQEQLQDFLDRARRAQQAVDELTEVPYMEDAEKLFSDEMRSQPSFTCPRCGMTSYNPNDIREGYCGNCHTWTGLGY